MAKRRKRHYVLFNPNGENYRLQWVAKGRVQALALLIGPQSASNLDISVYKEMIREADKTGESTELPDGSILFAPYMERNT
jgi:hypothetical protein